MFASGMKVPTMASSNRNLVKGVWELARLHTKESWLCWYPAVWGACFAAGARDISMNVSSFAMVLFSIWATVTATHCTFCTFNDICDRNLDIHVERCKTRPLPAGLISVRGAIVAFVAWMVVTLALTRMLMGEAGVTAFIPIWALSAIYPFMKRLIPFPQVVLGGVIGGAVIPGWVAVTHDLEGLGASIPLILATAAWVVYFDVFYATQDSVDDKKIGVKSLAVLMGNNVWMLLGALGLVQVACFAMTAKQAQLSAVFWTFGLGVWALNIPWHIKSLNLNDRESGGKIFKANIKLGLYLTVVVMAELMSTRVYFDNFKKPVDYIRSDNITY